MCPWVTSETILFTFDEEEGLWSLLAWSVRALGSKRRNRRKRRKRRRKEEE
jgi:hypothetical protein